MKPMLFISAILMSSFAMLPMQEVVAKESESAQIKDVKKGKKHPMIRKLRKMVKHLQLSEEQRIEVKAIFVQAKDNAKEHRTSMKDFKEQVKSLMAAPVFDEKAFTDIHSQYQTNFAEMALLKAKHKHAIFQILTLEQREKFMELNMNKRRKFITE